MPPGGMSHKGDDARVLWRRLPETCPRSYDAFLQASWPPRDRWLGVVTRGAQILVTGAVLQLARSDIANMAGAALDGSQRCMSPDHSFPPIVLSLWKHCRTVRAMSHFSQLPSLGGAFISTVCVCGWRMCQSDLIRVQCCIYQVKIQCQ